MLPCSIFDADCLHAEDQLRYRDRRERDIRAVRLLESCEDVALFVRLPSVEQRDTGVRIEHVSHFGQFRGSNSYGWPRSSVPRNIDMPAFRFFQ